LAKISGTAQRLAQKKPIQINALARRLVQAGTLVTTIGGQRPRDDAAPIIKSVSNPASLRWMGKII
jgi:hypothetical protein